MTKSKKSPTISIALPGCIIDKAQSTLLKAYLAGQIARAVTIFGVDEVIIFSESGCKIPPPDSASKDSNLVLYRLLKFLETPPYLRRSLFPLTDDYKHVAVVKPIESMHHPLNNSEEKIREGVIIEINDKNCKVNVGLKSPVEIVKEDHKLKDRVTVRLKTDKNGQVNAKKISKKRAKRELGYFGYSLRLANDVKDAIKNGPFKKCYDLTIGTSERGEDIAAVSRNSNLQFRHMLVVFGGPKGLENCRTVQQQSLNMPKQFDYYLNAGIKQCSRTIRTEVFNTGHKSYF